jgi:hypothetical protein
MAIVSTGLLVAVATRLRTAVWLERWVARDVPGVALAVPVFTGMVIAWTMAGIGLGLLFSALGGADERGVPGVENLPYAAFVAGLGLIPAPPLLVLWPRYWWLPAAGGLAFIALFGLLMPYLATR